MNYVSKENMADILDGIARKIGQGGSGTGLEDWQAEKEYTYNDICVYEGQIYRAKVGFTSDTTFSTTQILEEYEPVGGETIIPYEKDTEISINDIVSYDNNTYKALYNFVCGEEFSLYALEEYVPIELTENDIKEIIEAYNPVLEESKGIEYSTEERRIGTWIDGKPLYQKTYECSEVVPYNSWTKSSILAPSNVARLISSQATTETSVMNYISCSFEDGYILLRNDINDAVTVKSITIQYTKTTD